jgi:hypothetical protein
MSLRSDRYDPDPVSDHITSEGNPFAGVLISPSELDCRLRAGRAFGEAACRRADLP